jgi:bacterioferritin-associated ferredoxin
MIICICHRISDRDIAGAVREGCASFDQLQDETRVATACGACHDCAREVFHAQGACARAAAPVAWRPLSTAA